MQNEEDDNFEVLLRAHLSRELDGQLGRAPAAFARSGRRRPWRAVVLGAASLAAAAMLAIALMRPAPPVQTPQQVVQTEPTPAEYQLAWQTFDRGTVFLDEDTPARSFLRRQVEVMRWIDPQTKQPIEVRVPRDEVLFIGLNTF